MPIACKIFVKLTITEQAIVISLVYNDIIEFAVKKRETFKVNLII